MSVNETTAFLSELESSFTAELCQLAAAVAFIYDCIITVDDESKYFWCRPLTGAAILFYLNSLYLVMAFFVMMYTTEDIHVTGAGCPAVVKTVFIFQQFLLISPGAFSGLRAYALSQSRALGFLVFFLSVVPTAAINSSLFWFGFTGEYVPALGCFGVDSLSPELTQWFTVASRLSLITADTLLILITWYRLRLKDTMRGLDIKNGFLHVLLRDGSIDFLVLVVLNSLHLIFTLLAITVIRDASNISLFIEPMTAILVGRFLLHLQSANDKALDISEHSRDVTTFQTSTVIFHRVVGSIGASISPEDFLERSSAVDSIHSSETLERSDGIAAWRESTDYEDEEKIGELRGE